ncbi:MAG TPA: hypothetical protein VIL77_04070 [Gaiellaceae bacterium]
MSRPSRIPGTRSSRRVRALFLLPSPDQPGLSAAERLALTLRREATVSGRCVCGAVAPRVRARRGEVTHVAMVHESDCPAANSCLQALAARLGDALTYEYVVVELEVAA